MQATRLLQLNNLPQNQLSILQYRILLEFKHKLLTLLKPGTHLFQKYPKLPQTKNF